MNPTRAGSIILALAVAVGSTTPATARPGGQEAPAGRADHRALVQIVEVGQPQTGYTFAGGLGPFTVRTDETGHGAILFLTTPGSSITITQTAASAPVAIACSGWRAYSTDLSTASVILVPKNGTEIACTFWN